MDRVLCGMRWSRCLVYLDDVISFGVSVSEALGHLEEVLCRLSDFGLQLKAKKCTFMQTEVAFLGHIVIFAWVPFAWTDQQQAAFDALRTCLMNAPILGFPTEDGHLFWI